AAQRMPGLSRSDRLRERARRVPRRAQRSLLLRGGDPDRRGREWLRSAGSRRPRMRDAHPAPVPPPPPLPAALPSAGGGASQAAPHRSIGASFDEEGCEDRCQVKLVAAPYPGTCPSCLAFLPAVAGPVRDFLDQANALIYCESPGGAFLAD